GSYVLMGQYWRRHRNLQTPSYTTRPSPEPFTGRLTGANGRGYIDVSPRPHRPALRPPRASGGQPTRWANPRSRNRCSAWPPPPPETPAGTPAPAPAGSDPSRSEEHTSELQSRENLVCRLLLGKKNGVARSEE